MRLAKLGKSAYNLPSDSSTCFRIGVSELMQSRWNSASAAFRRACDLSPKNAEYWYYLGFSQGRDSNPSDAADSLRNSIELDGSNSAVFFELGQVYRSAGSLEEAAESYRFAIGALKNGDEAVKVGAGFTEAGLGDEAASAYLRATELSPGNPAAWESLALSLQALGRFEEAKVALQRVLELRPDHAGAMYRMVAGQRASEQELLVLQQMLGRKAPVPNEEEQEILHYAMGKANEDLGRFGEAALAFEHANGIAFRLRRNGKPYDGPGFGNAFDTIARRFGAAFFEETRPHSNRSDAPILIVGMPRSGTSLVEQILSAHPMVAAGSELEFWLEGDARQMLLGRSSALTSASSKRIAASYLQTLSRLANGRVRVTDKQPNNYIALGLAHSIFPNCRIVHCRRNPIDTCLSIYHTPYKSPPEFAFVKADIVAAYRLYQKLMEHWRQVLPANRFLEIDYETLVADGESSIRQLLEFCGLPWSEKCLSHETASRLVRTPSFWQVRQPLNQGSVGKWKRYEPWLGEFATLQ